MKAITYNEYGPPEVLRLNEIEKPEPKDGEVLIRMRASVVTAGDCNARGFTYIPRGFGFLSRLMFGIRKPKKPVLGHIFAGVVEETGKNVSAFKIGDPVFGMASEKMGAYAEYICLPESAAIVHKPSTHSFPQAVAYPFGATTALYFLRDLAKIQSGQKILVIGASGGVGTYAVQLAKYYGAEVTGVCSASKSAFVKSLGADKIIDYTTEDFIKNGETYDIVFDTAVKKYSFDVFKPALKENGLYLAVAGGLKEMFQMLGSSIFGKKKVLAGSATEHKEDIEFLCGLIEAGRLKPIIDKTFSLEQTAEAHRYFEVGSRMGSVVIAMD